MMYPTPEPNSGAYVRLSFLSLLAAYNTLLLHPSLTINLFAGKKIVTEILPAGQWWDAEDYHQLYLFKNPSGYQCPTHRLHW